MTIGIYKIKNKTNDKVYIGQSINIEKRWVSHKRDALGLEFENYPLYRSIKKYGIDNFEFVILEECLVSELNEKEIYYIELYKSYLGDFGYNQTKGGQNTVCKKISFTQLEEIVELLKNSNLTQNHIAEMFNVSYQVISDINTGKTRVSDINYPIRKNKRVEDMVCPSCGGIKHKNSEQCLNCYKIAVKNKETKDKEVKEIKKCYCIDCGVEVYQGSERCQACHNIAQRKTTRPDKQLLLQKVATTSFTEVGREYQVSDNTIRKWCKAYQLPTTKKEIIELFNKSE